MRVNLVLPTYYILLWNVFIVFFLHLVFFLLRIFFFGFLFIGLRGIIGRHSCFTDYARNLNGKRPVRSRQLKLYVKVTQISQMTQIQTCSVYGMTQIQTCSVYGITQIQTCSVYGMTQIFFLHRITRSYRKENLRNLRNLRDYTSCSSGYSTAQVAFRLNSVRNP